MKSGIYEVSYQMRRELHHKILVIVTAVLLFSLGMTFVLHFLLFPVREKSVSMSPTVAHGTCVLVSPFPGTPGRGTLVLLNPLFPRAKTGMQLFGDAFAAFFTFQQRFPYSSSTLMSENEQIRRVVGVPGDTIYMKDYVLYIKPADKQQYLTEFELVPFPYNVTITTSPALWDGEMGSCKNFSPIKLGKDQYFVLADNRCSSVDSRFWGPIEKSRIRGRILLVYFPFNHFRLYR